jgi:type 2 lantibiotic biosynthesis protein LanM
MRAAPSHYPPTPDELRRLGWDAASLSERVAALEPAPRADSIDPSRVDLEHPLLARWRRLLSPDDPGALARRLSWDGLDASVVARALASPVSSSFAAPWTGWLERVLEKAEICAGEISRGDALPERLGLAPDPEPPFLDLWIAWLRAGRGALDDARASTLVRIAPSAMAALERELLAELSEAGGLVVLEEWKTFRLEGASGEGALYPRFIATLLGGELAPLCHRHPLWARDLARRLETWTARVREMIERLAADREALAAEFGAGADQVVAIEPGLSDPHDGGRRVSILRFASGLQLVYKPREVDLERAFQNLLGWLSRRGCPDAPPSLRILARPGYGWVEHVREGRFSNPAAVPEFYRRAGSLLCLGFVMGARDWHQENVFATSEGPVIVDAEMLLGPGTGAVRETAHDAPVSAEGAAGDSCLASGLLGWWHQGARGRLFEGGGLQPALPRARTLPLRRWVHPETDDVGFVLEETLVPCASNRVLHEDLSMPPEAFSQEVALGFVRTYELLLDHRDEILSPQGPLAAFAGLATRVLFRPSDQYGAVLQLLQAPSRQGLGVARSVALEALNAVFARDQRRPVLWPLVEDERAALEGLDVPRFALPTTETSLRSRRGARVSGHFSRSGLDCARDRLSALGAEDLARQHALVLAALEPQPPVRAGASDSLVGDGALLAAAVALGRSLRAHSTGGALVGQPFTTCGDLYRGHVGMALFLSALGAVVGGEEAEEAQAVVRGLAAFVRARGPEAFVGSGLGACSGLGSLIYGLTWCAKLAPEKTALELAVELAVGIGPARIEEDPVLDVEGGVAGLLLALLALLAATGERRLLSTAELCGRRLVGAQEKSEGDGAAWAARDGSLHAGFAHGAAGIASALGRLHEVTGDAALATAVQRAHEHERSLFSPTRGNWPHVRSDGGTVWLMAWCHGAPGVALGRFLEGGTVGGADRVGDMRTAMQTTAQTEPSRHDHLCCGRMGQADALLTVGRGTADPGLVGQARNLAGSVAQRVLALGWRGVRSTGYEHRVFEPGFFRGLAGVGYQLLRVAHPDRLPSVVGFEARTEGSPE